VSALVRVLLADDHTLVRAGIRALLTELPGVQVVAEAGDGREALELARIKQPNLVLMDISMRGLNGIEATAQLKRELPDVRVII
jgi:DNA-binding NarL/FixJ family response regulator